MAELGNSRDLDNAKILSTLSHETLIKLSLRLDVTSPAFPVDWRALAGVIGFSALVITNIASATSRGDKTQWLLEVWERCTTEASVKNLILALAYLDLQACLDIIKRDKNIQEASFDEAMETYRTKSEQDGWERSVFSSIKDETVDLWAIHGEKKVVIEMQDKEDKESEKAQKSASSAYPEYRPVPTSITKDTIFVSYYKDDKTHHQNVLELSKWLGKNGYTVFCKDFYEEEIGKIGLQKWTEEKYSTAEHILLIGSKGYLENCQNRTSHVSFDYFLLTNELVCKNNLNNKRVIVVLMGDGKRHRDVIPQLFLPFPPTTWPNHKSDLLRRLQNVPKYEKPKVGKKKLLTSIVEKF